MCLALLRLDFAAAWRANQAIMLLAPAALVIAVGCTGGRHRSVAVTHALAEYIRELGYSTSEHHRDLERGV